MSTLVFAWLASWARATPDRIAVELDRGEDEPMRLTFCALEARSIAVASDLRRRGLGAGDRIMILAGNDLDFVATFYAAMHEGVVVVPTPTACAPEEIRFRVGHARVRLVVTDSEHHALAARALATRVLATHRTHTTWDPGPPPIVLGSALGADADADVDAPTPCDRKRAPAELTDDALALLLYTSGTTGAPKAACITHASLVAHTSSIVRRVLELGPDDVVLGAIPLTHSYGIRMALLAPHAAGARTVLVRTFETARVRALLREGGITWFPGVPTMFSALARPHAGDAAVRSEAPRNDERTVLRSCLSAGAPLAPSVRSRAEAALGVPIFEGYGLTEATFSTIDDARTSTVRDSVGRPVPGVDVRIVDDRGLTVGADEPGEILVRGPNVMLGYFEDPASTDAALRDGWLVTGDIGSLDASGRLRITDRKKDLILRGGFNVVPAEVEAALVSHPDIEGALVVGVPNAHWGEEIAALLTLRRPGDLDLASLITHLDERLATTKRPRLFAIAEALPLGPSGKALRRAVRDRITAGELCLEPLEAPSKAPS